ncbi:MAG TPA: trehalose-phosphatase, partial [Nitrococcus sp.]|nr:trehalose-phosphatase [Nitrococcus sp.]
MAIGNRQLLFSRKQLDAVIFALDGVVVNTAPAHAAAWKAVLDDHLQRRSHYSSDAPSVSFTPLDYRRLIDGRSWRDEARGFLKAHRIELPEGTPDDPPQADTVCGFGQRKQERFLEQLRRQAPSVVARSVRLIQVLRTCGYRTAVVTSGRSGSAVLRSAGLEALFDVHVDGSEVERLGLPGKPDPDALLYAAQLLGVPPQRSAVIEASLTGVAAARTGDFALIMALTGSDERQAYIEHGADGLLADLTQVSVAEMDCQSRPAASLPSALAALPQILQGRKELLLLLDYDGTLTPIVERPELAVLAPQMRAILCDLVEVMPVAVVSGRDLGALRELVGVPGLAYVGDHGFDMADFAGESHQLEAVRDYLPALDTVERCLRASLEGIAGVLLERKRSSIAVHFRLVAEADVPLVQAWVRKVLSAHLQLKVMPGKKVIEIQPGLDWDKGKAVEWLLPQLDTSGRRYPIYIGD